MKLLVEMYDVVMQTKEYKIIDREKTNMAASQKKLQCIFLIFVRLEPMIRPNKQRGFINRDRQADPKNDFGSKYIDIEQALAGTEHAVKKLCVIITKYLH